MFKTVTAWKRYMQYITSIYFSTKVSLSHSLSCSLSLAPSPLSYLSSSLDVIANSILTSGLGFPAALVVWLPTAAWLIVHIGHHCPIPWLDYASKPATSDWCLLGFVFFSLVETFQRQIMMRWMFQGLSKEESQSNIFNLETCCTVHPDAIFHRAGENVL